jgi:hemerythrin
MHIQWQRKYETGIEKVDEQHRKLVDILNKLYENVVLKKDPTAIQDAMVDLKLYSIFHFTTEERLFKKYKYDPDEAEKHICKHHELKDEIAKYFADKKTDTIEIGYKLVEFLEHWLFSHILGTDMKFSRHMKHNYFTEISADDIYFDDENESKVS